MTLLNRLWCLCVGHTWVWHRRREVMECFHCLKTKPVTLGGNQDGNEGSDNQW